MKITKKAFAVAVAAAAVLVSMTACSAITDVTRATIDGFQFLSELGAGISSVKTADYTDTHDEKGRGYTFAEITFKNDKIADQISSDESWSELPLSDNLEKLAYGSGKTAATITDADGKSLFPKVSEGYYFFRGDKSISSGDENLDFTLSIFDSDSKTMYYCRWNK